MQVHAHRQLGVAGILCGGNAGAARQAHQEAGVRGADAPTTDTRTLEVGKARLVVVEGVTGSGDVVFVDRRVLSPLRANFVGMVAADVGSAQDRRWLVLKVHNGGAHAHAVGRAEPAHSSIARAAQRRKARGIAADHANRGWNEGQRLRHVIVVMDAAHEAKPGVYHHCGRGCIVVVKLIRVGVDFPVPLRGDGRRQAIHAGVREVQIVRGIEAKLRPIANIVVDLDTRDVALLGSYKLLLPVVHISGSGGIGEPTALNLHRYRVEQGLGDHIARKWRARHLAIHRLVAVRIEDHVFHDRSARWIGAQRPSRQNPAEIPALHGNGRHGHVRIRLSVSPVQFQVREEESLVTAVINVGNHHWAADGTAIVSAPRIGPEVVPVA